MHTQTASEYWNRRGSLVHTDTEGNDLHQPDGVRISPGRAPALRRAARQGASRDQLPECPNTVWRLALFRAMLDAMDRWATEGAAPPESRYSAPGGRDACQYGGPGDGSFRRFPAWAAAFADRLPLMDFGETQAGVLTKEPPELVAGKEYVVLVPAVDADGNEVAGVRAPMVGAPLGTYTGWNMRARGFGYGALYRFEGSYLPFPTTRAERAITGDPRAAILERYPDHGAYMDAIGRAARALATAGLLLEEDVGRCIAAADGWGRPRHVVGVADRPLEAGVNAVTQKETLTEL